MKKRYLLISLCMILVAFAMCLSGCDDEQAVTLTNNSVESMVTNKVILDTTCTTVNETTTQVVTTLQETTKTTTQTTKATTIATTIPVQTTIAVTTESTIAVDSKIKTLLTNMAASAGVTNYKIVEWEGTWPDGAIFVPREEVYKSKEKDELTLGPERAFQMVKIESWTGDNPDDLWMGAETFTYIFWRPIEKSIPMDVYWGECGYTTIWEPIDAYTDITPKGNVLLLPQ